MATMEEKMIQGILEEILYEIFPTVSLDDSLVTDDYVIGEDQEAPSGTNGEEFHVEVVKKPMIGSGEDEGQMKDKIEGKIPYLTF